MDEQRDSTTSDGTILPLRMVANILRLRLDVGWVLLIACVRLQEHAARIGTTFRRDQFNSRIKKPAGVVLDCIITASWSICVLR